MAAPADVMYGQRCSACAEYGYSKAKPGRLYTFLMENAAGDIRTGYGITNRIWKARRRDYLKHFKTADTAAKFRNKTAPGWHIVKGQEWSRGLLDGATPPAIEKLIDALPGHDDGIDVEGCRTESLPGNRFSEVVGIYLREIAKA